MIKDRQPVTSGLAVFFIFCYVNLLKIKNSYDSDADSSHYQNDEMKKMQFFSGEAYGTRL